MVTMESRPSQTRKHASVSGSPGHSARTLGLLRVLWPLPLLFLSAGAIIGWATPYRMPLSIALASLCLVVGMLAVTWIWSNRRLERYLKGAEGEEMIARVLGFLPSDYHVFHSVWLTGESTIGDIDHVVVGPNGVFALETKNWTGQVEVRDDRILVDGRSPSRPPLRQVYRAARELRQMLDDGTKILVKVCPVLCFAKGDSDIESDVADVLVCDGGNLVEILQRPRGEMLSPEKIERIMAFLEEQR